MDPSETKHCNESSSILEELRPPPTATTQDDEQQALRDIIAELVTENATLKASNARLQEDNEDLVQQAANYLAHMAGGGRLEKLRSSGKDHSNSNDKHDSENSGANLSSEDPMDGSIPTTTPSPHADDYPLLEFYQRTIDELELKVMTLTEEKSEMMTRIENLEYQLMVNGSSSNGAVAGSSETASEDKPRTLGRGFLPGIFFSSSRSSNGDDASVGASSPVQDRELAAPVEAHQYPDCESPIAQHLRSPARGSPKGDSVTSPTSSRDAWNRQRDESIAGIDGLNIPSTSQAHFLQHAMSKKTSRSSLFSGRFSNIYSEAKDEGEIMKKPDYFGTADKVKRRNNSYRLSTAAPMVDEDENERSFNLDSRKTGPANLNLLL